MELLAALQQARVAPDALFDAHRGPATRVRDGQAVFHRDDEADAVYLLLEGSVRLSVSETTLLLKAPALFGDRDLLTGHAAQETAHCMHAGRLLIWPRDTFLREQRASAALRHWLNADLLARYARTMAWLSLSRAPLRERLLAVLHDAQRAGLPPVSRAMLGRITDATPKSIARGLRELGDEVARDSLTVSPAAIESRALAGSPPLFHSLVPVD